MRGSRHLGQRRAALLLFLFSLLLVAANPQELTLHDPSSAPSSNSASTLQNARLLANAGHYKEAEATLLGYLQTDTLSADANELLGFVLLRENRPKESLNAFTRAASLRTPNAEDLKHVAQDYALLDDLADADRWIKVSVAKDPADADAWYNFGRIQYTEQLFGDAIHSYEKALALSAKNVKVENNMGLAYEGQNRLDLAVACYRQAIAWQNEGPATEKSEQPLLNLAIVLLHQGELSEATPLLAQAASVAPKNPRIHEQLGHLYLQQSDFASARRELETALTLDPSNSSLHFLLGQAYRRLGLTELAQKEFADSTRLANPDQGRKP